MPKGNIEYKDHPGPGGYNIIEGNLGKDPERRESGEKTFVTFNLGTSVWDYRERKSITVWVQVTVSGFMADKHYDNLKVGDKVSCMGQISITTGEDLDSGEEVKVYWKMFATDVHYTGRAKRDEDGQNGSDEEPEEEEKPRRKKQRQSKEEEAPVSDDKDEVDDLFD